MRLKGSILVISDSSIRAYLYDCSIRVYQYFPQAAWPLYFSCISTDSSSESFVLCAFLLSATYYLVLPNKIVCYIPDTSKLIITTPYFTSWGPESLGDSPFPWSVWVIFKGKSNNTVANWAMKRSFIVINTSNTYSHYNLFI